MDQLRSLKREQAGGRRLVIALVEQAGGRCLAAFVRPILAGALSWKKRAGHTHWPRLVLLLSSLVGLCGWALCPGLVLLLSSVAGPCPLLVLLLSLSWPRPWALWLGSVAQLCVQVLSSSCPCLGRAPELCGWSLWPGLLEMSVAEQIAMSVPTKIH